MKTVICLDHHHGLRSITIFEFSNTDATVVHDSLGSGCASVNPIQVQCCSDRFSDILRGSKASAHRFSIDKTISFCK